MVTSAGTPDDAHIGARNPWVAQEWPQLGGTMARWLALSDHPAALGNMAQLDQLVTKATLVFEVDLPLTGAAVLLDFKAQDDWPRALSLFVDDATGVAVLHRQGDRVVRHFLPGPLDLPSQGVLRIVFEWDGPGKAWTLTAEMPGLGQAISVQGSDPMPMLGDDLLHICQGGAGVLRHRALQWFGLMQGKGLPNRTSWIGTRTPIDTVEGPKAAGQLQPGDMLLTEGGDYVPLMSVQQMVLPSRGSFSPVLLRAPYFGAYADILVSSDQLIAMSGDAVEYLFGLETVLTQARSLTDGRAAMMDSRRAVTSCVALDLGTPQLIEAEGCRLLTHCNRPTWQAISPPHAVIQGFETMPLLGMLGRHGAHSVA